MRLHVFLSSMAFTFSLHAATLAKCSVPNNIVKAVADAYEISREQWDSFGIADLKIFDVRKNASLREVLAALLSKTDEGEEFMNDCQEALGNDVTEDLCVAYLLQTQGQSKVLGLPLADLFGPAYRYYGKANFEKLKTTSEKQYAVLMSGVIDYVKELMPIFYDYYVFKSKRREYGVDVETMILVSFDTSKVLLVRKDSGS